MGACSARSTAGRSCRDGRRASWTRGRVDGQGQAVEATREAMMGSKSSKEAHGAAGKGNLLLFDPEELHLNTDKKHKLYDPRVEDPIDDALVASILYKGVVEPIIVWKDPEMGKSCVLDGKHRVQAARAANKILRKRGEAIKLVQAVVSRGTAVAAMGTMTVANEGRTPPTPMQRARRAEALLSDGYDEAQVATLLHCSPTALKNYIALIGCSAAVRQAVDAERIPPTVAYKLSKLEPAEQKEQLEKMLTASPGPKKRGSGKKMRAAVGEQQMRGKGEIEKMLAFLVENRPDAKGTLSILRWVLGGPDPLAAPKTVN